MQEGQTQTITLEDVESGVFGLLVNWLYTQKVKDAEEPYVKATELAKLWNLAQRFIMPVLQNDALTQFPKTLRYYNRLWTTAKNQEKGAPVHLRATTKDKLECYGIAYTVEEMTALKRYLLDHTLALRCAYGDMEEGSKEVPKSIARACLLRGGKSMVEDFSMLLAKHCSDFEADQKTHPWKFRVLIADYMVPVHD
jgi:hypothetical protein